MYNIYRMINVIYVTLIREEIKSIIITVDASYNRDKMFMSLPELPRLTELTQVGWSSRLVGHNFLLSLLGSH